MAQLGLYFIDGTQTLFGIDRLDRDEVDQFLEDVSVSGGGFIVTDDGPLALPAGGHGVRAVRVLVPGDQWLDGRVGGEDLDDD